MPKSYRTDPFEPGGIPPELTVVIEPLFRPSVRRTTGRRRAAGPDRSIYFAVMAPPDRLSDIAHRLLRQDGVVGAYVVPPAIPRPPHGAGSGPEGAPEALEAFVTSGLVEEA